MNFAPLMADFSAVASAGPTGPVRRKSKFYCTLSPDSPPVSGQTGRPFALRRTGLAPLIFDPHRRLWPRRSYRSR